MRSEGNWMSHRYKHFKGFFNFSLAGTKTSQLVSLNNSKRHMCANLCFRLLFKNGNPNAGILVWKYEKYSGIWWWWHTFKKKAKDIHIHKHYLDTGIYEYQRLLRIEHLKCAPFCYTLQQILWYANHIRFHPMKWLFKWKYINIMDYKTISGVRVVNRYTLR